VPHCATEMQEEEPPSVVAPYRLPAESNTIPPTGREPSGTPWKLYKTLSFQLAEAWGESAQIKTNNDKKLGNTAFLGWVMTGNHLQTWIPACRARNGADFPR